MLSDVACCIDDCEKPGISVNGFCFQHAKGREGEAIDSDDESESIVNSAEACVIDTCLLLQAFDTPYCAKHLAGRVPPAAETQEETDGSDDEGDDDETGEIEPANGAN